jgi:hypothetical protein
MPAQPRPGKKALYVELPNDLDSAIRSYCEQRGLKLADEIRLAIRRHLANPPQPTELPPLPPMTVPAPTEEKPATKRGKGKK